MAIFISLFYYKNYATFRCSSCNTCGATTPGFGSEWQSNHTQCGPCASYSICPVCKIQYKEGNLLIRCDHCHRLLINLLFLIFMLIIFSIPCSIIVKLEYYMYTPNSAIFASFVYRWLHGSCDGMNTEEDVERVSEVGYHCKLCRPLTGAPPPGKALHCSRFSIIARLFLLILSSF